MTATAQQSLDLDFHPDCPHDSTYTTGACVPAGDVCMDCGALISQYIPQSPAQLGYLSADYEWHHILGNPWTTL